VRAFTLTELLIVIGIMGVLIGILIPVVSGVRTRASEANSRNNLQVLSAAIDAYQRDFDAYPGPLSNEQIERDPSPLNLRIPVQLPSGIGGFDESEIQVRLVTMPENLTLGLVGGLRWDDANNNQAVNPNEIVYDPSTVGQGPASLNPRKPNRTKAYLSDSKLLLWGMDGNDKTGRFRDERGSALDTIIPEFGDGFPSGLPVLYLRPRNETRDEVLSLNGGNNDVAIDLNPTFGPSPANGRGAYNIAQITGYTRSNIGAGATIKSSEYRGYVEASDGPIDDIIENRPHGLRSVDISAWLTPNPPGSLGYTATFFYPFESFAYLRDPVIPFQTDRAGLGTPRGKGRYLLISAGADRTYGTRDDITSFGRVGE
jgi:prepilin-type N-terminal cleavage/methylation domain-containing protein